MLDDYVLGCFILCRKTKPNAVSIEAARNPKLQSRLVLLEMKPRITGPTRNPRNPIPETIDMPTDAGTFFTLPASLNNSGIITESPNPKIPNPITDKTRLESITNK